MHLCAALFRDFSANALAILETERSRPVQVLPGYSNHLDTAIIEKFFPDRSSVSQMKLPLGSEMSPLRPKIRKPWLHPSDAILQDGLPIDWKPRKANKKNHLQGKSRESWESLPCLCFGFTPPLAWHQSWVRTAFEDLCSFRTHMSFSLRSDQLSADVIRISVVIILPTWSSPDCPSQWEERRKLVWPMRREDRHGAMHSCRGCAVPVTPSAKGLQQWQRQPGKHHRGQRQQRQLRQRQQ